MYDKRYIMKISLIYILVLPKDLVLYPSGGQYRILFLLKCII